MKDDNGHQRTPGRRGGPRQEGRKNFARAKRDREAAKLYTTKNPKTGNAYTQQEIADLLGEKQTTISGSLRGTFERFQRQAVDIIRKHRQEMIVRSATRYAELDAAWLRSQQDAQSTRIERSLGAGLDAEGKPVVVDSKAVQTKEGQVGDPRFVGLMRLEDEHLAKLLGLYEQAEVAGPEVPVSPGDTLIIRVQNSPNGGEPKDVTPERGAP